MIRKSFILTLVILTVFSLASISTFGFNDMLNDWSTEALEKPVSNGLLNGYDNLIRPNDSITRAEVATIINRAFNTKDTTAVAMYTDLKVDNWFYIEMAKAVNMGTFNGNNNKLNPNAPITRE